MRLKSLDSLRGIAALVVVLHHCMLPNSEIGWIYRTPLKIFVAGPEAVLVFFVLSGLVLSMTFIERDKTNYMAYLSKRFCRIWLPFAFAILVAAILNRLLGTSELLPGGLEYQWSKPVTSIDLVDHLAMVGTKINTIWLDGPMWSLVHEMRISLVFPIIVAAVFWNWPVTLAATVFLALGATKAIHAFHLPSFIESWLQTSEYVFLFVLGNSIAYRLAGLRHAAGALTRGQRQLLWIVALIALCLGPDRTDDLTRSSEVLRVVVSALGSAAIVLLCVVEGRAFSFLMRRFPVFLGRVSYSLYLLHSIVLALAVRYLHDLLPLPVCLAIGVSASIVVAAMSYALIEMPTMSLGRYLARCLQAPASHLKTP